MPTGQSRTCTDCGASFFWVPAVGCVAPPTRCVTCDGLRVHRAMASAPPVEGRDFTRMPPPGFAPLAGPAWSFECHRFGYAVSAGACEDVAGELVPYRDEQDARSRYCDPCPHLTGLPGSLGCTLDREVAKCGALVAPGTCDGRCLDCAEWPEVCGQARASAGKGVTSLLENIRRFPCPPEYLARESCIGCPHLRAEVTP